MGIEVVENNREEYRAFMEVTSYFWGSKGGRGALMAETAGTTAANGIFLSKAPKWIASIKGIQDIKEWKSTLQCAWEKNILVIGIIKDISSAEMMKTVIPILKVLG